MRRLLPPTAALLGLIAIWELVSSGKPNSDILPAPSRVISSGWADRSDLWANTLPTLGATLLGFALAMVLAFSLSILIDRWAFARGTVMPLMVISQTLPIVVLAPLMVLWFGFGLLSKLILVVLVTFFPLVVSLVEGYATSDPDAGALFRSTGAGWWRTFRGLRLPSALPSFFTGLRIAVTYAVVATVFAEYAGSEHGLGIYMQVAKNSFRTDLVLAAVVVTSALTLLLFLLTHLAEWAAMPWRRAENRQWDGPR